MNESDCPTIHSLSFPRRRDAGELGALDRRGHKSRLADRADELFDGFQLRRRALLDDEALIDVHEVVGQRTELAARRRLRVESTLAVDRERIDPLAEQD